MRELFTDNLVANFINGKWADEYSHPWEDPSLVKLREEYGPQINELLDGKLWVSQNVLMPNRRRIPAGGSISVKGVLPNRDPKRDPFTDFPDEALDLAILTTRSRLAQQAQEMRSKGGLNIEIQNHSERDMILNEGDGIGYYIYGDVRPMVGQDLERTLEEEVILVGDIRRHYSPGAGVFSGIELPIDPESSQTIKPYKDKDRMKFYDGPAPVHNRAGLSQLLERAVFKPDRSVFIVSDTKTLIYLPKHIHGFCSQDAMHNGLVDIKAIQTNSIFLMGGNTGKLDKPNSIRTEDIVKPGGRVPNGIVVRLVKAPLFNPQDHFKT
jgi:hypothetical protein